VQRDLRSDEEENQEASNSGVSFSVGQFFLKVEKNL
jgi:hypothetical protein